MAPEVSRTWWISELANAQTKSGVNLAPLGRARLVDHLPADFHVLAPDLPGHGTSEAGHGDHSVGAAASAIRDLMVAVGLRRATLIGHSLGGGVVCRLAALWTHPHARYPYPGRERACTRPAPARRAPGS